MKQQRPHSPLHEAITNIGVFIIGLILIQTAFYAAQPQPRVASPILILSLVLLAICVLLEWLIW